MLLLLLLLLLLLHDPTFRPVAPLLVQRLPCFCQLTAQGR
jgi:hypothetical protein